MTCVYGPRHDAAWTPARTSAPRCAPIPGWTRSPTTSSTRPCGCSRRSARCAAFVDRVRLLVLPDRASDRHRPAAAGQRAASPARRGSTWSIGPTPLHQAPRLSHELGVELFFKRDDLTGAGLGGNKLRGLEYLVADALAQGCDSLVTGAGPQSNWTMLAALACLRYGIEPHIVCYGTAPGRAEGNLRLHRWLGVDVQFTGSAERPSVDAGIDAVTAGAAGRPAAAPTRSPGAGRHRWARSATCGPAGAGRPAGRAGPPPAGLWLATGSCGTQAGLLAGAALTGAAYQVLGVTVSLPAAECRPGPRPGRRGGHAGRPGPASSRSRTSGTAGSARATASRRPPGRPPPGWSR